ncbi:MAG: DivIVA domain-containing protein [Pyramidobacter sp.]|nr:DivIVA domain-containing protein [Pyramidobacter sp.]
MNDGDLLRVVDVEGVVFSKGLRGYVPDEVDEFLDHVADTLQRYAEMHAADQMKIRELENALSEDLHLKESLQEALEMAKNSTDDLKASAQKECEALLAEARVRAESIIAEAKGKAESAASDAIVKKEQILREIDELRRARDHFVADAKAVVLRYNMLLDNAQSTWNL